MKKESILKSIFLRKGSEGKYSSIKIDEEGFLVFNYKDSDEIYFTISKKIIGIKNKFNGNKEVSINLGNVKSCIPAFELEFQRGNKIPSDFSLLYIQTVNNGNFIAELEKGGPYKGIHQMLNNLGNKGS